MITSLNKYLLSISACFNTLSISLIALNEAVAIDSSIFSFYYKFFDSGDAYLSYYNKLS
jgi:hypothetical protein